MTRQSAKRRVTSIVLVALAIGISAPAAGARPFDLTGADAVAPVHVAAPPGQSVAQTSNDASGGDISNVGYVADRLRRRDVCVDGRGRNAGWPPADITGAASATQSTITA